MSNRKTVFSFEYAHDRWTFVADHADWHIKAGNPRFNFRGLPPYAYYASARGIGAEWWPDTNWLVRAEWHNMEGTGWINAADNEEASALRKYWDLIALQLSFRF